MSKAYVGTTNRVKVEAVKTVLTDYEVIGLKVPSNVSSQPKSDQETIQGALNRANALPKEGIRIGLEAGVQELNGIIYLINWGVLIDQNDNIYYAGGTRLPLPFDIGKRLFDEDIELSDVINEYYNREDIKHQEGAVGILTSNYVKRIDIFIHIVNLLYGQYKFKKE
jgi:non-canonical (house-cleaning) NTP pyrophosphatase